MVNKETIIRQLKQTSNEIAKKFDGLYIDTIEDIADELSIAFNNLKSIIDIEDQSKTPDHHFQAVLLFWASANSIISSLELFRRGYPREPLIILRQALEVMSTGYAMHVHPEMAEGLLRGGKGFSSTKSISEAKKAQPILGPMYGILSQSFTHVGILHVVPHHSDTPLCVGGLYDSKKQEYNPIPLSMMLTSAEILNSLIELVFFDRINNKRFWESSDGSIAKYKPLPEIKERQRKTLISIGDLLSNNQ